MEKSKQDVFRKHNMSDRDPPVFATTVHFGFGPMGRKDSVRIVLDETRCGAPECGYRQDISAQPRSFELKKQHIAGWIESDKKE